MKCPKCHYLSFEPEARCRNCGYDLALSDGELPLRAAPPEGPLADLALSNESGRKRAPESLGAIHPYGDLGPEPDELTISEGEPPVWAAVRRVPESEPVPEGGLPPPRRSRSVARPRVEAELDESVLPAVRRPAAGIKRVTSAAAEAQNEVTPPPRREPPAVVRVQQKSPPRRAPTTELPLFVKGLGHEGSRESGEVRGSDEPLVREPPTPTPPVAVQRRAPVRGRARPSAAAAPAAPVVPASSLLLPKGAAPRALDGFGRDLLLDLERLDRTGSRHAHGPAPTSAGRGDEAALGARARATAIDLAFLGGVGGLVFWLTLRWAGLGPREVSTWAVLPLGAFVLIIALGYLLMFTAAGGQTLGKMAIGLRVVSDEYEGDAAPVTPRQAVVRALTAVPSVGAFGLGFIIPALAGRNQAFHDHAAHTRVVRE